MKQEPLPDNSLFSSAAADDLLEAMTSHFSGGIPSDEFEPKMLADLRKDLDVTDGQKEEIRDIVLNHKSEIIKTIKTLHAKKKAVLDEVRASNPNEAAIRAAVKNMSDDLADAAVLRATVRKEAMSVLTKRQNKQVKSFLADVRGSVDEAIDELAAQ